MPVSSHPAHRLAPVSMPTALSLATIPRPRSATFSVLVVHDQPLPREALCARLRAMGAAPVHEAVTVAEAHAQARASGPCDLAVLHLALPGSAGLDLITELRSQGWHQLVVLASSQQPTVVRAVFQAGAQAYLLSTATVATITDGIARVLTGGLYADPNVAPLLAAPTTPVESASRPLSLREIGVLELVADGQTNKQIGENLVLSAFTIKSHLSRIGRKLGAGDRAHMVAKAIRAGIIR